MVSKRTILGCSLLAVVCVIALSTQIARSADEAKPAVDMSKMDPAKMMDEMAKAAAPGPEHQSLASFEGDWDADCKFWMAEGAEPQASKGVMHGKMILGGRYLQLNFDGEMNGPAGKTPFKGMGIAGYDKAKKKYTSVWVDEMSTGMMITEGTGDGKTITSTGECMCPLTNLPIKVKEIATEVDKDHHKYELHMTDPGGSALRKCMEITYTRKKS